ncbi:PEGA domain-containing protein [Candidatus Parcubacteria bacterium]|nr:PEGA domain-containing protein [Candidatus Parcubacteria bacterium]
MELKTRRILYIFFILLFCISTPLISFYASGYKFSSGLKIQKTGILIVDTEPEGAKIFLNEKIQQKFINKILKNNDKYLSTPVKIKNLAPGEYDVKISKQGYWDWQKKLMIKSGESTYIEDVTLFKQDSPMTLISGKYKYQSISYNKEYISAFANDKYGIINLNNNIIKTFPISASTSPIQILSNSEIKWSRDNKKILINNIILDAKTGEIKNNIKKEIGDNIKNIKWAEDNNSILYLDENNLNKYNLVSKRSEVIVKNAATNDFCYFNGAIYIMKRNHFSVNLIKINPKEKKENNILNLPFSDYSFLTRDNNYLNVYDEAHEILYIINPNSPFKPLRETLSNIKLINWINNEKLLYANKHEIWIYDLNSRKNTLLTRISQEIKGIIWHPSNNYAIYNTPNSIYSIELDNREKYNIIKLITLDTIQNIELDKNGDNLYFYSKAGEQEGIYKLSIQ